MDDTGIEDENGELYAQIRALPLENPLPEHLQEFERSTSMVQMEVNQASAHSSVVG